MATVRTTCPYCGVGCGVLARPGVPVQGDPDHPANFGRLCSKGTALADTLSLDNRLLHPQVDGRRAGWDAALERVAAGFRDTIARHGPDSVALYVSGQLLTEDYYAANKLAKGFLGTGNIDSNSRLCMASAAAAHKRAFGEDLVPGVYADLEQADLVVLVGSNLAWCHPVLYQRLQAARAARPHMRLVVIDPRRTATCEGADLHLPLRPGSDVALFCGLLQSLADAGLARHAMLDAALAEGLGLDAAAAATGLDLADLLRFFTWFGATEKTVTLFSQGVNQSSAGTDKANAIINVHLATGRIGRPGAGPFSITGQPNAMGGREVGALANLLAAHLDWDKPADVALVREHWQAPRMARGPGLKAVDLFRAVADRRVRALWVMGTNPAVSMPDGVAVRRALERLDLLVVSDCVPGTDTQAAAHVCLPALAWGEKSGTVTNSERVISRQRAFLPVPGEARADWWMVAQVAKRLGHGDAFAWRGTADIFREHARLSGRGNDGARVFDISALAAMTDAEYDAMVPVRWPVPARGPRPERLCAAGGRLVPTRPRPPAHAADAAHPLILTTGRIRDQWHTMTRTGRAPRLFAHSPEPLLSVHPDDAPGPDGALAEVGNAFGSAILRLRHDPGLRRGTLFAPMHWTSEFCAPARINAAVNPDPDPLSGQPELKHTPVWLKPFQAGWYGFVLSRTRLSPAEGAWQAVLPIAGDAWRHELAGPGDPAAAFATLMEQLVGEAGWMTWRDPARRLFRAVRVLAGRLDACVFLAPAHVLPARDWLAGLFTQADVGTVNRRALLAGAPPGGTAPDRSVCVCHGVGERTIAAAIAAGCTTLDAVGATTRAGTGCGSCRPEITAMLKLERPRVAA